MTTTLKTVAAAAALLIGASGMAMAQTCPPGYFYGGGMCQPAPGAYAPNNPVSGAAAGGMAGAARGEATAGPVGAIVGGAIGTATGTIAGTTNAVLGGPAVMTPAPVPAYGSSMPPTAPPACSPGYMYYSGACYPAR